MLLRFLRCKVKKICETTKKEKGSPCLENLSFQTLGARWDLNPRPSGPQSDILTN